MQWIIIYNIKDFDGDILLSLNNLTEDHTTQD